MVSQTPALKIALKSTALLAKAGIKNAANPSMKAVGAIAEKRTAWNKDYSLPFDMNG